PREDRDRDDVDAGLLHEAYVFVPHFPRPLVGVVIGTERDARGRSLGGTEPTVVLHGVPFHTDGSPANAGRARATSAFSGDPGAWFLLNRTRDALRTGALQHE